MSYLNNHRLTFSGRFQSDVSTVNNDVTHFDVEKFKANFQEYGAGATNGWWNPCGSGAFRLFDCHVTEVCYADGTTGKDPTTDPVIGMTIGGSNQQVSAKMVDLDPQMQMVSEIWGLNMRLTDGVTSGFFDGQFMPSPFRDILFGRQQGQGGGDISATAIYQSVLSDVSWLNTDNSAFLQQLKALSAATGKLSVRMMVYSYNMDHNNPEFTLGHVSGVIGPALENEPNTFILGRRFAPQNGTSTAQNINFFNAQLDTHTDKKTGNESGNLCVDLSNALPLANGNGAFADIGAIQLVALNGDFNEGTTNLAAELFTTIGQPIPYLDNQWMQNTGAIFNVPNLTGSLLQTIQDNPLALLLSDNKQILIRETQNGLLVRADQVVHRLNPDATVAADLYAAQYGVPLAGQKINISLQSKSQGTSPNSDNVDINIPASSVVIPDSVITGAGGKVTCNYDVTSPHNPRGYIDGQVYLLNYTPPANTGYVQHQFDILANLVFDDFTVLTQPTWADIQPIMKQYGNLYPVMSKMLVDLGHYESVVKHRSILELAFSRPLSDPNYMPVTRDLSEGKRQTIMQWLTAKNSDGQYLLAKGDSDTTGSSTIEPCESCMINPDPASLAELNSLDKTLLDKGSKFNAAQHYARQPKS